MLRRRLACTLKRLCLVLLPLLLCAGCWQEIRYTPPEKKSAPSPAADTPQPTNDGAKASQSSSEVADHKAP
jgi:hypothetical protein